MDILVTIFSWAFSLTIGIVLAMHVLLPLLVWKQQGLTAHYDLEKLPADTFLAERNEEFRNWHQSLLDMGFEYLGSSMLTLSHAKTYVSLYRHENGLAGTVATSGNAQMEVNMLEFTQVYADGSVLSANNSTQLSVYPRLAYKQGYRLPAIRDARVLMQAALLLRKQRPGELSTLTRGREFEEIADFLNREQQDLLRQGYFAHALRADGLRGLSLKGAYLMSWKLLWPTRPWLDALQRRQGIKALAMA
ncbi:MAG: hypothetical protein REI12_01765 [Pedobacter sp.]|nr:hypothetical protein [Pedobacter sp.]